MSPRRRAEDPDRAAGVEIITRLLVDRDRTPHADQLPVQECALGILQALTAQGWRRTGARAPHAWADTAAGAPATPESVARHLAAARAALPPPRPGQERDGA